jgi:hypothetical protein
MGAGTMAPGLILHPERMLVEQRYGIDRSITRSFPATTVIGKLVRVGYKASLSRVLWRQRLDSSLAAVALGSAH